MIEIDGKMINPAHVISAMVTTRHYANGSQSSLIVRMADGSTFARDHGYGFDAWAALRKIEEPAND